MNTMYSAYHGKELICVGYDRGSLTPGVLYYLRDKPDVDLDEIAVKSEPMQMHPRWLDTEWLDAVKDRIDTRR